MPEKRYFIIEYILLAINSNKLTQLLIPHPADVWLTFQMVVSIPASFRTVSLIVMLESV